MSKGFNKILDFMKLNDDEYEESNEDGPWYDDDEHDESNEKYPWDD